MTPTLDYTLANWNETRRIAFSAIGEANARGSAPKIMAFTGCIEADVMMGLAVWRMSSDNPTKYFKEAIEFGVKGVNCIQRTNLFVDDVHQFSLSREFSDVRFLEVLLDQPPSPELYWMCHPPEKIVLKPEASLVLELLDWLLLEALHGGDFESGWDRVMAYVISRQKKQRCVHATYTAYRTILLESRAGNPDAVRSAVREADAQFEKRKNDGYFSGGYATSCGGQYNDRGIDFRLAAVLKCAEQQGGPPVSSINTIHKWRW